MSRMFALINYIVEEHQLFRTWLIEEFCPAMRVNPPPTNPHPPPQENHKDSSSDDSSPTVPQ
ncbi:hypothetical protein A2U01_0068003 [Trifolium medium]|uniref:Uncharacterized protein n=1 Tax=Trifolium medium TaxID=97028 RepID=A0A392SE96_9FABA|nr:hypothetical protein [Trifolium medium]